jgi:predicted Zn-dependent peptidase
MANKLDTHTLKNGMVLLGEPMEAVESVAFSLILPAGAARLPEGCCGAGSVISDWIFRGAGDNDSKQLCDKLDGLGLHRATSVASNHLGIGVVLEAGNLREALKLYADIILRPQLKEDQFELAKRSAIDSVKSLDDDPRQKVMLKLCELFLPTPLGRNTLGEIDDLNKLTAERTTQIIKKRFNLSQAIFSIAGKYDFDSVRRQIEELFETDEIIEDQPIEIQPGLTKYTHFENDGAQVHIGLATETVKPTDDDYYNARIAESVLSGGMSARLFTEVREKRGLCYAVGARYVGLKQAAGFTCYAGTTPEKAQETLDVIIAQFNRLKEGISDDEIERAKVGLKSSLILNSESTSSRSGAIANDHYLLGRVRSLDEIKEKIEQTTAESVVKFLRKNEFKKFTVVTIGPKKVEVK